MMDPKPATDPRAREALRHAVEGLSSPGRPGAGNLYAPSREVARLLREALSRAEIWPLRRAAARLFQELLAEMDAVWPHRQPIAREVLAQAGRLEPFRGTFVELDTNDGWPNAYRVALGGAEQLSEVDDDAPVAAREHVARAFEGFAMARASFAWSQAHPEEEREEDALGLAHLRVEDPGRKQHLLNQVAQAHVRRMQSAEWQMAHREAWDRILAALG